MNGVELSLIGSGNIIAMIGHSMVLSKSSAETCDPLTNILQQTKDYLWLLLILASFLIARLVFLADLLAYGLASLLVMLPILQLVKAKKSIFSSQIFFKNYYFGAISLKLIGFSVLLFGIALWTLKINALF